MAASRGAGLIVWESETRAFARVDLDDGQTLFVKAARALEITLSPCPDVGARVVVVNACADAHVVVLLGSDQFSVAVPACVEAVFYGLGTTAASEHDADETTHTKPWMCVTTDAAITYQDSKPLAKPYTIGLAPLGDEVESVPVPGPLDADRAASPPAPLTVFTGNVVGALYGFPTVPVSARTKPLMLGIIELGGAYDMGAHATYFGDLRLPAPPVRQVYVGGARPGSLSSMDSVEVALDVQVAGAVAPAGTELRLYYGPNTVAGFVAAIRSAVADGVAAISISWGAPESSWPPSGIKVMNDAFAAAGAAGIPVFCATGDSGDGGATDHPVNFPASSPYVVACGGTSLRASAKAMLAEVGWRHGGGGGGGGGRASGSGGSSALFPQPVFQKGVRGVFGSTRCLPDVCGSADPATGYKIKVGKYPYEKVGGTSAVAPLYAGLAVCLKALGASMTWPRTLYSGPSVCVGLTAGENVGHAAGPAWDAVTGLGRLDGAAAAAAAAATISAIPSPAPSPAHTVRPPPLPTPASGPRPAAPHAPAKPVHVLPSAHPSAARHQLHGGPSPSVAHRPPSRRGAAALGLGTNSGGPSGVGFAGRGGRPGTLSFSVGPSSGSLRRGV